MDALDRRILSRLATDSDVTSAQLGEAVGLSPSATHRRTMMLEERGLITGYRAILSKEARGNPSSILVSVTLQDQKRGTMEAFEVAVAACDYVRECYLMSGEQDYLIHVEVPDDDSFERVHRQILSALPGVARLASHFVIRTIVSP